MASEAWTHRRLSECADQRTEKITPAVADARPYVGLEHLAQGRPALLGWSPAGSATSAKTVFRTGDVLFGKLRPNLRKAAAAPFDGLCSTDILPLFGKNGLDTHYLLQLAQWNLLQQHAVATASGTKMPRTSWKQLGDFAFSLPPLPEQRKIATILSSVDDAIEKTRAVIDQVQVVKRELMQELLTRGLPGRHTRFRQTEIGEIPEEWSLSPLPDAVFFQEGPGLRRWLFRDHGMPFINIRCIKNDGTLDLRNIQYIAEDKAHESYRHFFLETNDTVLSSSSFGIQNDGKSLHHRYHSNSSRMVNTSNWRLRAKKIFTLSSNAVMRVSAQHPKASPSSSSVSEIIARNRCHSRPAKLNAFNRSCISARTSPMRALSHSNFA